MTLSTYSREELKYRVNNIIRIQCKYELKNQVANTSFHFKILKWDESITVSDFFSLLEDKVIHRFLQLQNSNCRWLSIKLKNITQKTDYILYPLNGNYGFVNDSPPDRTKAFGFDLLFKTTTIRYDLKFVASIFKDFDRKEQKIVEQDLLNKVRDLERIFLLELNLLPTHQLKYVKYSKRQGKALVSEPLLINAIGFVDRKKKVNVKAENN